MNASSGAKCDGSGRCWLLAVLWLPRWDGRANGTVDDRARGGANSASGGIGDRCVAEELAIGYGDGFSHAVPACVAMCS